MCFGVRDAIALAMKESEASPITILGELVHNATVLDELRGRGIRIQADFRNVATDTVMVTAHGISQKRLSEVQQLGLNVLSAACPLVEVVHKAVQELVQHGFHPVIIGKRDHVEVRGLTEDLHEFDVVLTEEDILNLPGRERFGVVAQTTQPIEKVRGLTQFLRETFPQSEVRVVDTVCRPTKERQEAASELAQRCDIVVVIGGAHSNNTRELVQTCNRHCRRVHHVQTAADLNANWFFPTDTVGITAGTSTPDDMIDAVERTIAGINEHLALTDVSVSRAG
jgi:4-hydroxy-3-methylbut-2-enyl diphosphate reductase